VAFRPLEVAMSDDLPEFSVQIVRDEDEQVIVVHGELDLVTGPCLQTRVEGVIESSASNVIIDLADVGYIDSTGLAVLLAAHDRLARTGRHLRVENPSVQVLRLFEICGVRHLVSPDSADHDAPQDHGWCLQPNATTIAVQTDAG
jgi:anti-sigma B factor antagonist